MAIMASRARVVGIGNPSKNFAFPDASLGRDEAVTLKRARRERPERRKKARIRESRRVLMPRLYAIAHGATPNEIWSC